MSRDQASTLPQDSDNIFKEVSDTEYSLLDTLSHNYESYVRAPFSILINDWRTVLGLLIIFGYLLVGTVGVRLINPTYVNEGTRYVQPFTTTELPLGTTSLGEDLFSLLVHGTPPMFEMFVTGATVTVVLGTAVGTTAGLVGGRADRLLMTFSDTIMIIPGIPLILVLTTFISTSSPMIIGILIAFNYWASLARQIRSEVLSMRELGYVKASQTMGLPLRTIILKDILPNLMSYIVVNFVKASRRVIFASVGLYFLGVLAYEDPNWGITLNQAYTSSGLALPIAWHTIVVPTAAIVVLSLGLTLLAQGSDRMFNPRLRAKHASPSEETPSELK